MRFTKKNLNRSAVAAVLMSFIVLSGVTSAEATATKCKMHLGAGCGGPVVYEVQLCARVSVNGEKCHRLCEELKPVCNVSDFDNWVKAYNSSGVLSERLGKNGYKGDLAQATNTENYDEVGQLQYTSGNAYTVCISSALPIGPYSSERPVSSTGPSCATSKIPSEANCKGGTVFNGDPTNPKCVTKDSYCSGGGAAGNYAVTMSAGFQMVDIQNQHFIVAPQNDSNLQNSADIAGTNATGFISPITGRASLNAATIGSSNPTGRSSSGAATAGSAGSAATASAPSSDSLKNSVETANPSAFASKDFAMEGAAYKAGAAGIAGAGNSTTNGASWFGAGSSSGAAAVAGTAGEGLGFEGVSAAARGLAADGSLNVEDPENYFLRSDVEVSLFKRVTAQFRRKERSLVLAPVPVAAAPQKSAN